MTRLHDRGASMFMVALSLLMLVGAAAIAVDLAAMRADRSTDQKVTDSAASAGALAVYDGGGQQGCETALAYVGINSEEIGSLDTSGCVSSFSTACTPGESHTVSSGRFTVTITYPVSAGDPLMTSGVLGATTQSTVPEDGDSCERIAVRLSAVREGLFGKALGFQQGTTTVHSVARAFLPPPDGPPINLLLLDRFGCEVMKASGNGGIIVEEIVDSGPPLQTFPGEGAVDSDASSGCPSDGGTIDIDGNNAVIRADGPPGCPNEGTNPGDGCGALKTLAPGTPGCIWPACTASGSGPNNPNPAPTASPGRLTRAPIDHRYNCRVGGYTTVPSDVLWAADPLTVSNEQDIPPCPGPDDPRIHQLIQNVREMGLPNGTFTGSWETWTTLPEVASLADPCVVTPGDGFSLSDRNVWVDCAQLEIKAAVTITDGSMVLDGNLAITSSTGHLTLNNDASDGFQRFVFMRDGLLRKDGQASLTLNETFVYASKTSRVQMDGGSGGSLTWIAPDEEGNPNDPTDDHPFDDLALWSDSTFTSDPHFWAGQASLVMEGVFFVPIVTVEYAGQGAQLQTKAQFISDKLHARGQGVLVVAPVAGRAVDLRAVPQTVLLR